MSRMLGPHINYGSRDNFQLKRFVSDIERRAAARQEESCEAVH